jgi:peptidyl-prolyl cis-trans isomerase C
VAKLGSRSHMASDLSEKENNTAPARPSLLRRCVREPLVQFVLIGAALFAFYRLSHQNAAESSDSRKIALTSEDLDQMTLMWRAQGRPPPTEQEIRSLLDNKIREEVLYREALKLGLDKDDTIVKRRMVQKMDFLAEDLSDLREPSREELKTWFKKNSERFTMPGRVSFRHLYFSSDKHGKQTSNVAAEVLKKISAHSANLPEAAALADPFMFQDHYGDSSFDEVAKTFGPQFARSLFTLTPGSWQGPIESGYGWHLVLVESLTPARVAEFEEIEADVRTQWISAQREEIKRRMYEKMRSRYEIFLPRKPAETKLAGGGK